MRGEYLVGANFNPSGDSAVDRLKAAAAAFINEIETIRGGTASPADCGWMVEQAMKAAITAQMWAVKAVTLPHPRGKGE